MSPAIAKTTDAQIVAAARALIRKKGAEAVTLSDVADAVGIRAPSLYKRFANRAALLRVVKDEALNDLEQALVGIADTGDALEIARAMAVAYRVWALGEPELFRLTLQVELKDPALEAERRAAAPALRVMETLVGAKNALAAARCFTSFLTGFVTMEIDGNFGFDGSVEEAFRYSVTTILKGLTPDV